MPACRRMSVVVFSSGLAFGAVPGHGGVMPAGPVQVAAMSLATGGEERVHELDGATSLDLTETFFEEDDVFQMHTRVSPHEARRGASMAFTSHAIDSWGDDATFTLSGLAADSGSLVLAGIDEWYTVSGGLTAWATVSIGGREDVMLQRVGEAVWIEAGSPLTIAVTMSWQHAWPEASVGWLELEFVTIPGPAGVIVLAIGATRTRRRRSVAVH